MGKGSDGARANGGADSIMLNGEYCGAVARSYAPWVTLSDVCDQRTDRLRARSYSIRDTARRGPPGGPARATQLPSQPVRFAAVATSSGLAPSRRRPRRWADSRNPTGSGPARSRVRAPSQPAPEYVLNGVNA
ncbi:hypothetical protein LG3211_1736 [Lysobacter gummosus]|nr:hypothetical protein LG3211_1736 [Lysobacter gummosus]